jgi:pimeloyl-ACP methyl ester carboxylesterase
MSTYVLIHGAWEGSWCWEKVVPLLKQAGHQVETLDLPGHGQDRTPLREITLAAYTKRVCETLDAQAEPVILVGHSMGGIVISQVAEERPEKIATLVYLAAYLLQNGESLSQVASVDTDSLLLPIVLVNREQGYATFKEEAPLKEVVYADCSDEDVARARSLLVPQALAPFVTPISTTVERFGRVPRVYIECLRDRVISPYIQKKMYTALPCQTIISMETSHSPFFSASDELVRHLTSLESVSA